MTITHLADVMQSIVDVACECLETSSPLGRPGDCFISHNTPPDDCCDFLSVWVERIRPSEGFADGQYVTGGRLWARCGNLSSIADVNIRLVRPCFPVVIDDALNPFPPAIDIQAASEALAIDAWVLNCCIHTAISNGELLPDDVVGSCLEVGIGDMVPHGPNGGCAGWTWDLSIELGDCCL